MKADFRTGRLAILVCGIVFGLLKTSEAAKAPMSLAELDQKAELIVRGQVISVDSRTQKSQIETGIGIFRDRVFTLKVKVGEIKKGQGITEGETIEVRAWKPHVRVPSLPGLQGHESIPAPGEEAEFFLKAAKDGGYEPLLPNGIALSKEPAREENSPGAKEKNSAHPAPNIILIMADDLGYMDLGCYGHPQIKTPVLDELAGNGAQLTSFYSGATVCTPSRMALLTGAYPSRFGWEQGVIGFKMTLDMGLSPEVVTAAEVFKAAGYRTGLVGKWHLGDRKPFLPNAQGFDETYYINKSNNQTDEIWRDGALIEKPFVNRLLTEKFAGEAREFIKRNSEKRFFLYLPFSAPHFPVEAHPDWEEKSEFGAYGDVVEELDSRIGEIITTLREEKIHDQTMIIFLSDNGPQPGEKAQSGPFNGAKWDAMEGGTRVPCIVSWPGIIPAGTVIDELTAAIDLLPTMAEASGINPATILPPESWQKMDGLSFLGTLTQKTDGYRHPRNELLYWHGSKGFQAIRVGNWKLFPHGVDNTVRNRKSPVFGPRLFNLATDPGETKDLSKTHPEKIEAIRKIMDEKLSSIDKHSIPIGIFQRP